MRFYMGIIGDDEYLIGIYDIIMIIYTLYIYLAFEFIYLNNFSF